MVPHQLTRSDKDLVEYADVFAKDDLDLGQTSVVKHKITLIDRDKPVKEHYRRVPPILYDKVQKHPQEMIDIGTIHPTSSLRLLPSFW